jgi:hypothetical protein
MNRLQVDDVRSALHRGSIVAHYIAARRLIPGRRARARAPEFYGFVTRSQRKASTRTSQPASNCA